MSFQQNDETAAKTSQSLRRAAAFIKICAARSLSAGYLLCYRTGLFTIRFFRRTGRILGRLFRPGRPAALPRCGLAAAPACPGDRR